MAKTTITQVTDDLDGSANAEEVRFAYDGTEYTIDLAKKNRTAFEKALKPYLNAATKVGSRGGGQRRRIKSGSSTRPNLAEIRAWAKHQGMEVSERGRVSRRIIEAYDAR